MNRYYVRVETHPRKGVVGYGVYDCAGGMESQHAYYEVTDEQPAAVALHLATADRDDRNAKIA